MQDHYKLEVYNEAYALALDIYKIHFPINERFGIEQQIRRASISIALNIAEGCGKDSKMDFKRALYIAMGSLKETETLIDFSKDLNYIDLQLQKEFKIRLISLGKKANSFIQKLKEDNK